VGRAPKRFWSAVVWSELTNSFWQTLLGNCTLPDFTSSRLRIGEFMKRRTFLKKLLFLKFGKFLFFDFAFRRREF